MSDGNTRQNKLKELLARHTDLEQSQNKAQGALLSVLALTQVTELKILLDVGTDRHKLYHFVLALLIGSIALQIIVGVIVIYIGHLRYQKEPVNKQSWSRRLAHCFICSCRPQCCKRKPNKRSPSYISVPIGVGTAEPRMDTPSAPLEMSASQCDLDDSEVGTGCCDWPDNAQGRHAGDTSGSYVQRHQAELEQAKVKVSDAVATILRLTNEMEKLEVEMKKIPKRDQEAEKQLVELRVDLNIARREKEQADAELALAESRQKQAVTMATEQEERDEHATFRRIRSWQQVALYLLYFITLMNIFVTAIGISVA